MSIDIVSYLGLRYKPVLLCVLYLYLDGALLRLVEFVQPLAVLGSL